MAKDPAFLFYASDFITGVGDLTMEERGQYITLLCHQHQKGRLTKKAIDIQCNGNATADVMAKFRQDENGLYYNERLELEIAKRAEFSKKQAEKAKTRWNKDKNNNHGNTTAYATVMPLENRNEIVNENRSKNENEFEIMEYPAFSDFWDAYDKKRGDKDKVQKKWKQLTQKDKEAIMEYLPAYLLSTPDKQFRKDPLTFLNNKSWNDEIITATTTKQPIGFGTKRVYTPDILDPSGRIRGIKDFAE